MPKPITMDGATVSVEGRVSEQAVVVHVGLLQFRFNPAQARVLARELRRVAGVIDPDPTE